MVDGGGGSKVWPIGYDPNYFKYFCSVTRCGNNIHL